MFLFIEIAHIHNLNEPSPKKLGLKLFLMFFFLILEIGIFFFFFFLFLLDDFSSFQDLGWVRRLWIQLQNDTVPMERSPLMITSPAASSCEL